MASDRERDDEESTGGRRSSPGGAIGTGADESPDIGKDTDILPPAPKDGLLDHFVRRTDAGFSGKRDRSLIGEDVGWAEDELDEDGEPLKP